MAKATRVHSTSRRTKSSSSSVTDRPGQGDVPMKAPGSKYEFWSGVIGLDTTLCVFDGACPAVLPS
jgi:hypothetical protein